MSKKATAESAAAANPPVWFLLPKSFYLKLARYAREFGLTQDKYLKKAIDVCAVEMREREKPLSKSLGDVEVTTKFRKMAGKASRDWWANLSEEEKAARAKKASDARWKKAHAKAASSSK